MAFHGRVCASIPFADAHYRFVSNLDRYCGGSIVRPIRQLIGAADEVATGNLDVQVPVPVSLMAMLVI